MSLRDRVVLLDEALARFEVETDPDHWNEPARSFWMDVAHHIAAVREALSEDAAPAARLPCHCTHEAGDSPCPLHGMDEEPAPAPRGEPAVDAGRTGGPCVECGHGCQGAPPVQRHVQRGRERRAERDLPVRRVRRASP